MKQINWACVLCQLTFDWCWGMGRREDMEHSWGSALGQGLWPRVVHRSPVGLRSPEGSGTGAGDPGLCHPVGSATSHCQACGGRGRNLEHRLLKSLVP